MSNAVNSVGLVLDIAGAVLLFFFVLPRDDGVTHLVTEESPEPDERKVKRDANLARLGLFLLIAGFGLQFASNIIQ